MFTASRARPTSTELITLLALTVAILVALSLSSWALGGPGPVPGGVPNPIPSSPSAVGLVTHDLATGGQTPASLVRAFVGPNVAVNNIHYSGAPIAAGTFSGGTGIIGIEEGILLSSGNVASVVGPINQDYGTTTDNQMPGDPDLSAIIGNVTRDASVLEFDVQCPGGMPFSFECVFSSEEYNGNPFINDVFACFLNGENIALIPGTNSPVSVSNVNCGAPYNPPSGPNCSYYVLNDCESLGLGYPCTNIATEMDGLTVVLTATAVLQTGLNHIKLAIADDNDGEFDADVFIRGVQNLDCSSSWPVFEGSSPCSQVVNTWVGMPVSFGIQASATNGFSGEAVTLTVTGSSAPLAGGTFLPPLPAGPAQPVSTQFQWTPTGADVGSHTLTFKATDQLGIFNTCDVSMNVAFSPAPVFEWPTFCGTTFESLATSPLCFQVHARATNGLPGESVTLTVTGDATPLASGTFAPPLPAGPTQPVSTRFLWTPSLADVGTYHLQFTATDQLQSSATCDLTLEILPPTPGISLCSPGMGAVMACPCNNPPLECMGGCANTWAEFGARLYASGTASLASDTLLFTTHRERPFSLRIVYQGDVFLPAGVAFGQGVRCVGGSLKRLYVKSSGTDSITVPQLGDPSISARSAERGDTITAGTSRFYGSYFRDPQILGGCPSNLTFNTTQTMEIPWLP